MISKYFLDGFGTEEQLNELLASDVLPLVREMQFKYGLKIMDKVHHAIDNDSLGYTQKDSYMLCHPNGAAVGKVWTTNNGGPDSNQLEFCLRSAYYAKSRGQDKSERETIRSVKLSSLMATLKRQDVVTPMKHLMDIKVRQVQAAVSVLRASIGESNKSQVFTADEIHAMLATILGESTDEILTPLDLNKCKNTLDIYKAADKIRNKKKEESERFFKNPFYLIGIDGFKHLLIGKFKITLLRGDAQKIEYEVIEDFKRVKTIEEYPELLPLMTMMKVSYETVQCRKLGVLNFPIQVKYDEGLDAVFFYSTRPTDYDRAWMVTPCPT